ncbi:ribonuclease H-like [Liasis olivaceus]
MSPLATLTEFFVVGSSIIRDGVQRTGYAVITEREVVEAKPLSPGTSDQQAKLIALTRALELGKRKKTNIFTDSRYAFGLLHAFGGMWKNRGFKTVEGEEIKNLKEVQALLEAVHLPLKVAVMHVKGHGKALEQTERNGNRLADETARKVAESQAATIMVVNCVPAPCAELPLNPRYSKKEKRRALGAGRLGMTLAG